MCLTIGIFIEQLKKGHSFIASPFSFYRTGKKERGKWAFVEVKNSLLYVSGQREMFSSTAINCCGNIMTKGHPDHNTPHGTRKGLFRLFSTERLRNTARF